MLFYKFIHNLSPKYTREPISFTNVSYSLRNTRPLVNISCHTKHFENSFYPACIRDWNRLDDQVRDELTLPQFKKYLIKLVRPHGKPVFNVFRPRPLKHLFQLRLGVSSLKKHKFDHNFRDTHDPVCACGNGIEDTAHFLLHCHLFVAHRITLLHAVNASLEGSYLNFNRLSDQCKVYLLLYGDPQLKYEQNQSILVATLCYVKDSQRFTWCCRTYMPDAYFCGAWCYYFMADLLAYFFYIHVFVVVFCYGHRGDNLCGIVYYFMLCGFFVRVVFRVCCN